MDVTDPIVDRAPRPPVRRTSGTRLLLGLTLAGIGVFAASGAALWYLVQRVERGEVEDSSFLDVDLSGQLSDTPGQAGLFDQPDDVPPTVTEIAAAIRHAGTDDRITGILLDMEMPQAGWASFQELRDAVVDFRKSGKPCVAWEAQAYTNGSYYLASACEVIAAPPAGALFVTGLAFELTYYKGTFDKIGVSPEYEHVGDFKSFIEVYERTGPSEQAAQAYELLLDSLWGQMISGIAQGRGRDEDTVRGWIEGPTMTPQTALERGMIDVIAWPDGLWYHLDKVREEGWKASLEAPFVKEDEEDEPETTELSEYLKSMRDDDDADDRVAVIQAQGQIISGDAGGGLFGDDSMLTDGKFARWMEAAREDEDVKAVVVRVNSPGGSGLAAGNMWREVARTKAAGKPVVISMGDYAASGGYLMSCNADWIVAQPGTLTGSIGVFGGKFDVSGTYEKLGMTQHTFQRGGLADMLSFSKPFSDQGRAVFREYLETFYKVFVQQVADGRSLPWDEVHAVAQGRVWTGEQALERRLVDGLGGLDTAIAKAAELAKLETWGIDRFPKKRGFIDTLVEDFEKRSSVQISVPSDLLPEVRSEMAVLENIERTGGAGAMLPGRLRVK